MTEPEPTPQRVRPVAVTKDITVMAKTPTNGQMAVVMKSAAAAQRDFANAVPALDVVFRVITALVEDKAELARLDDGLIDGSVSVEDLMKIMDDDEEAKAAKRAPAKRTRPRAR